MGAGRPAGKESVKSPVGTKRSAMWQAMRVMVTFTCADVAMVTEANVPAALTFISALMRVGVVKKIQNHNAIPGSHAKYRLVNDIGPKTPVVRRIYVVYDPNSKTSLKRVNPIQGEL
ncbi:MAG: hypothetical protein LBQ86_00785 [Holophagales bacterium]|jgi:hypothetical protein|nr:hypothetical protein [Holophagales bacterium]